MLNTFYYYMFLNKYNRKKNKFEMNFMYHNKYIYKKKYHFSKKHK